MRFDKMKKINLLEFIAIFVVFVLPSMLNNEEFKGIQVPSSTYDYFILILKVVFLASYEEALYRLYLPFRLGSFFDNSEGIFKNHSKFYFFPVEFMPILFFSLAHRYLGFFSVLYAFFMGCVFRILYLFLKKRCSILSAFIIVALLHSANNLLVIYYSYF